MVVAHRISLNHIPVFSEVLELSCGVNSGVGSLCFCLFAIFKKLTSSNLAVIDLSQLLSERPRVVEQGNLIKLFH